MAKNYIFEAVLSHNVMHRGKGGTTHSDKDELTISGVYFRDL